MKNDIAHIYEYRIHGILLLFVSIFITILNPVLGLILLLLAISVILLKTGVELNTEDRTVRRYTALGNFHWGQWMSITDFDQIELHYSSKSRSMNSLLRSDTYYSRSFDIGLRRLDGRIFELIEYEDQQTAEHLFERIAVEMNMKSRNFFEEIRNTPKTKRRR